MKINLYRIPSPDDSKVNTQTLFERYRIQSEAISHYADTITHPTYLPWEKARFKTPPPSFNAEEAWYIGRELRTANAKRLPIITPKGEYFRWTRLDYTDEYLHTFDLYMGGQLRTSQTRISGAEQQAFLTRGVIEEAIASSQLEGASVTRKQAKDMLAENRLPHNTSEWMVHNNYKMMSRITEVYKDVPLSRELLVEMHQILAANTMEQSDIGRFRRNKDGITVGNGSITTYIPPNEAFVEAQLDKLISFANDNNPAHFMHPIIKAIVLHFWIGYLHPFVDGNGRIARALFYWLLLRKDYWLATYIPLSTVIKRAPIQYSNAYVYTEQDNNDFTYFYDYHMKKLKAALDEFLGYVERQRAENAEIDRLLDTKARLNERQKQVMHYLLSSERHYVTVTSHRGLNRISVNTARQDLLELQRLGLVFTARRGKFVEYYARPRN